MDDGDGDGDGDGDREDVDVSTEVELVFTMLAADSCASTIGGWLWYCDEHDTHGNADSESEAQHVAQAHVDWHTAQNDGFDICASAIYVAAKITGTGTGEIARDV